MYFTIVSMYYTSTDIIYTKILHLLIFFCPKLENKNKKQRVLNCKKNS